MPAAPPRPERQYWNGKRALVVGGSSGFGAVVAERLLRCGTRVAIAARDENRLQAAVASWDGEGLRAEAISADVTVPAEVDALVAQATASLGGLDLVVHAVGRSTRGRALETPPDAFRELFELNAMAAVHMGQACTPALVERRGHLVFIGSLASKSAGMHLGAYPMSKFALAAWAQQLRYELQAKGVHVLLVCPGPIRRSDAGTRYDDQTGDLPPEAGKPGGGVDLPGLEPTRLADEILRACRRRKPELVRPSIARWLFALAQLRPSLADRLLLRRYRD